MSDTDRLLALLQAAGPLGVHTRDLRHQGVSGNPSQRRADLEARGYTISSTPEPYPSEPRRRGSRYRLIAEPNFRTAVALSSEGAREECRDITQERHVVEKHAASAALPPVRSQAVLTQVPTALKPTEITVLSALFDADAYTRLEAAA